ncbi:MAG: S-layer homology domain-containing protein, partial [Acidobacteriota bacterium]
MNARLAVFLVVTVTLAGVAAADEVELQKPLPPAWGTSSMIEYNLHAFEFHPIKSDTTYDFSSWNKFVTGGYPALVAGLHLPTGARIVGFDVQGCDDAAGSDFDIILWTCPYMASAACDGDMLLNSSGFTGCGGAVTGTLAIVIENVNYSYFLEFNPGVLNSQHRIRVVEAYYVLQVSPAPGTATFADVPTSHPFFQYVEALAASGITAGCGGGNYCPN